MISEMANILMKTITESINSKKVQHSKKSVELFLLFCFHPLVANFIGQADDSFSNFGVLIRG